ncbi:MAG TPA: hypothetical protein VIE88_09055 [Vicinamibacteria bacterium]|jgi:iron complex transport system substrate-binding protein
MRCGPISREAAWASVVLAATGAGCQAASPNDLPPESPALERAADGNPAGCVAEFDPLLDYFPQKVKADHAHFFEVSYRGHYKILEIRFRGFTDNPGFESRETYVLVQCGTPAPPLEGRSRTLTS